MFKTMWLIMAVLGGLGFVVLAQDAPKKSSSDNPVDQTRTAMDHLDGDRP